MAPLYTSAFVSAPPPPPRSDDDFGVWDGVFLLVVGAFVLVVIWKGLDP